jgi:autotransporter translocation and assembly factor TamB
LKISDFTFNNSPVGNIDVKVNNETTNTYAANVSISGQDNQVNLDGKYLASSSSVDLDLDVQKLNLKSIEGFTMGQITQGSAIFNGKFRITGTTKEPKVVGNLKFNEIALRVKQLNSYFKSMNDEIVMT